MSFKVLFVDDEELLLEAYESLFESERVTILTASSGENALKILDSNTVSLVFIDYRMEPMNGIQLAEKISNEIDIYIYSGELDLDRQKLPKKIKGLLRKPIDEEEVHSLIAKLLK